MTALPAFPRISVIVPTLNEEQHIGATLAHLRLAPGDEILVVDGGSQDATVPIARQYTPHVLAGRRGRALQMNDGAHHARGDFLVFVHADTLLPSDGLEQVRHTLQQPGIAAGAFRLVISPSTAALRLIAWGANMRSRWGGLPYGDQALFMSRQVFEKLGGYEEIPLMEDVRMVRALRRYGRLVILPQAVQTSGRRWQRDGVLYTSVRNVMLLTLHAWGVSPHTLQKWYVPRRRWRR